MDDSEDPTNIGIKRLKFLTDGMLGKLTRWLRILGYDVKYLVSPSDQLLMEIAKEESRVLLTKDRALNQQSRKRGIVLHLISGTTTSESLTQLAKKSLIVLDIDMALSRCPKCNNRLRFTSKDSVLGKVPEKTYIHQDLFWVCSSCSKIYWRGAHWKRIEETMRIAKKDIPSY